MRYKIRQDQNHTNPVITLLDGKFSGIGVTINKVRFEEDEEGDECKMLIDYEIVDELENIDSISLKDSVEWMNTLGDFCVQILESRLNESKLTDRNSQTS
jgi:hypothetical protein